MQIGSDFFILVASFEGFAKTLEVKASKPSAKDWKEGSPFEGGFGLPKAQETFERLDVGANPSLVGSFFFLFCPRLLSSKPKEAMYESALPL